MLGLTRGQLHAFFTTRLGPEEEIDFSGLLVAPTIFQQEIPNKTDIKVTIVGDELFPCIIKPTGEVVNEVDWREGILSDRVSYEEFPDFPQAMRKQCLHMVQKLGLSFSAMEFVIDEHGQYWFIENNPNGQWAFIEGETGMPISASIAELLWYSGQRKKYYEGIK